MHANSYRMCSSYWDREDNQRALVKNQIAT